MSKHADDAKKPAWLSATLRTLGLGRAVTVDFAGPRTVLVGRNGAGKSAILEAFTAARNMIFASRSGRDSYRMVDFSCAVRGSDGKTYSFSHARRPIVPDGHGPDESLDMEFGVEEECLREGESTPVWHTSQGVTTGELFDESQRTAPSTGWLASTRENPFGIRGLLASQRTISAGLTRTGPRDTLFQTKGQRLHPRHHSGLRLMLFQILRLRDRQAPFEEFKDLLRQMELANEVKVVSYKAESLDDEVEEFEMLFFDGVNLSELSDGTLRVLAVLLALVWRPALLMLEEPENSLHPGLLARLLAILHSYSRESQILITTQSPQVVSWVKPSELRLVARRYDQDTASNYTDIRPIDPGEIERLDDYLSDEGTLGEFVYSGGVDDDSDWDNR